MARKLAICLGVMAVAFLVCGGVLLGCSWVIEDAIKNFVHDGIRDQIIVDANNSPGFKAWANNYDDHAPLYYQIYLYNVTNVDALKNGGTHITTNVVGPYTYWGKKLKFDVNFTDDGTKVSYLTWTRYMFLPESSCTGCQESDVIVNINPGYIGILSQTGSEVAITFAITGPITKKVIFQFLWGPFTLDVASQHRPAILQKAKSAIIANTTGTDPEALFYATWANSTQQNSPLWAGMLVSSVSGVPSTISLASATALFNASLRFSLLDGSLESAKLWRRAYNNDSQAIANLNSAFGLTSQQLWSLMNWLNNSCNPVLVFPNLIETYQLESLRDLAFLQWGEATVTNKQSIRVLYPEESFAITAEIALFVFPLGLNTSKMLLEGPYGLFDGPNLKLYQQAVESLDYTLIKQRWGLNIAEVATTAFYFLDGVFRYLGTPFVEQKLSEGNGLFTNRTVHQWLWDMTDPFLELLAPSSSQVALVVNQTSMDFVRQTHRPCVSRTGKDDWNRIGDYIEFDGLSVIDGVYAVPINVTGKNDAGEFIPDIQNRSVILHNFDENYVRDMTLVPTDYIDVLGVRALRYELSNDTWSPNMAYFQNITGFANLTGYHNGSTIFISNPHMYMCDRGYVDKISGMEPNATIDVVKIDIEPITGAVIQYQEGLQVNVYLDPKNAKWFDLFNPDVKSDIFYPVMIVSEFSTLRSKDAQLIKTLYLGIKLEGILFWVSIGVGIALIVLSVPTAALTVWRLRRDRADSRGQYQVLASVTDESASINASSPDQPSIQE